MNTTEIILEVIFCAAVIVGVVAPLAWAIFAQNRDEAVAIASPAQATTSRSRRSRRGRRSVKQPLAWPVR